MKKIYKLIYVGICLFILLLIYPSVNSKAAGIRISNKKIVLSKGQSKKLKLIGKKTKVKWISNCKSVASVNKKGLVRAKKIGKATIIGKTKNKKYYCKVVVKKTKHVHKYKKIKVIAPTCMNSGYTLFRCSCGKNIKKNIIIANGHTSSKWIVIKEAGINYSGQERRECLKCHEILEVKTLDSVEEQLNKRFSLVNIGIDTWKLSFEIDVNDRDFLCYDYWIQVEYHCNNVDPSDLESSIQYSIEQKQYAINQLKNKQLEIYNYLILKFPDKKMEGGYYTGYYKYPSIHVGYNAIRFLTWKNYDEDIMSNYYETKVGNFRWDNSIDDYKF